MSTTAEHLAAVNAAIANRLAGNAINYYMVGGKQVRYESLTELFAIRDRLQAQLAASTGTSRNLARFAR